MLRRLCLGGSWRWAKLQCAIDPQWNKESKNNEFWAPEEMPKVGHWKQASLKHLLGGQAHLDHPTRIPGCPGGSGCGHLIGDRRAVYTTFQGLNKRRNLPRKGLSGPPLAPRSQDLWDKASIHLPM